MTHRSFTVAVALTALSLGVFAGCYTKLMPFRDAVATRKASVAQSKSGGNFSSDLNYRDNCLSCHTEAELADRAGDMDYMGIHVVHGLPYDPYGWQNPYLQPPWWEPERPISIGIGPDRQPVITTNPGGSAPSTPTTTQSPSNANRRRETGSTRTTERSRDANPTATSTPTPTTAPTAAPSGSTGSGAVITTSPQPAQTSTPAPAADTRSRSGSSEGSGTRKSGSGRE